MKFKEVQTFLLTNQIKLMTAALGGLTSNGEKMKAKISNPIPEFRNSNGQEKLRTVFVFILAHLEGPPSFFLF